MRAASFSQLGVFSGGESSATIEVEGYAPKGDDDRGSAMDVVGPGYFSTLGVPITLGREILESDRGDAPRVCVINEAFAKRFFDRRNPIGMRITSVDDDDERTAYQVVGVARNARTQSLRGDVEPRYFVPAEQPPSSVEQPDLPDSHGHGHGAGDGGRAEDDPARGRRRCRSCPPGRSKSRWPR